MRLPPVLALVHVPLRLESQTPDRVGVERAALDDIEGQYEGDTL